MFLAGNIDVEYRCLRQLRRVSNDPLIAGAHNPSQALNARIIIFGPVGFAHGTRIASLGRHTPHLLTLINPLGA